MDLLQISGLVNYYGRTPESDNILIKPVLLQKGQTKLALYGMSNVRDERLFRTFRDGKVRFFQPGTQKGDWFNVMSVHQNQYIIPKYVYLLPLLTYLSHARTETGYLPENFLPEFLDLVVWGHEHECLIYPKYNPEMNFHVMQPGSSVATSLMPGEAVPKHVAILNVTGRDFKVEAIRLKTVRPFVMKEIVLSEDKVAKKLAKKDSNRTELTRHLIEIVDELIEQARAEWLEAQEGTDSDDDVEVPLPLIRLRVEYSPPPDGGNFDCENPQRFSNRFVGKVANVNDVVQFYLKKHGASRKTENGVELPEESILAQLSIDSVKVEKLVREFLTAQSLTILPQNTFGDAVSQFVDKDDKHAMEMFVNESLSNQVKYLMDVDQYDEEDIHNAMDQYKSKLEELFAAGHLKKAKKAKLKPKPDNWDSDLDGEWGDQPGALIHSEVEDGPEEDDATSLAAAATAGKGRGKAASKKATVITTTKKVTTTGKPASRGRKKVVEDESEEGVDDVVMVDDNDDDEDELFVKPAPVARGGRKAAAPRATAAQKRAAARPAASQSQLDFSRAASQVVRNGKGKAAPAAVAVDEISDDEEDAFASLPSVARSTRSRR